MSNNLVTMPVSFWAESEKSYRLLTVKKNDTWSKPVWFPKSQCSYDQETNLLTLPKWLYNKTFRNEKSI